MYSSMHNRMTCGTCIAMDVLLFSITPRLWAHKQQSGDWLLLRATRIRPRHFYYNWDFFQQDFAKLRGKRVWVIVTHPYSGDGVDEEVLALHVLDNMGKRVDAHAEYGAVAYLYQLRADPIAAALP